MKRKKLLLAIGFLCVMVVLIAFWILANRGWNWRLPQSLLSRVDFDHLTENVDRLRMDGFTDFSDALTEESTYYYFGKAEDENATPMIYVYWEKERGDEITSNEITYDANTKFVGHLDFAVGNKDGHRFKQEVTIWFDQGRIWMVYYTKDLFGGRQQVIDYLNRFCDDYCENTL